MRTPFVIALARGSRTLQPVFFFLGFEVVIIRSHLVATGGWSRAKPIARRGYNRNIVAKFGYGHKTFVSFRSLHMTSEFCLNLKSF